MIFFLLILAAALSAKECVPLDNSAFSRCTKYEGSQFHLDSFDIHAPDAKLALSELLRTHQKTLSYKCLWKALADTDRNPLDSSRVVLWYKSSLVEIKNRDCGQNDPDSWNREHIWAKSRGFPKPKSLAYRDLHHIRSSDRSLNTWRNNRYFAEFSEAEEILLERNPECPEGCFRDAQYFEPPSWRKGDIARALLYMDLRYNGHPDDKTPDLVILEGYPDQKSKEGYWGGLCTLLEWNREDLPTELEKYQNQVIEEWQGNPNPFVLHPDWADILYGDACKKL